MSIFDMIASGIQATTGVANTIGGFVQQRKDNKYRDKVADMTKEQNQIDREFAERMWNMNNTYNAPQAQMERFKAAGLNPNLIYGQMSNASPVNIPSSKVAPFVPSSSKGWDALAKFGDTIGNIRQSMLQNDLLQIKAARETAEVAKTKADTNFIKTKDWHEGIKTLNTEIENAKANELYNVSIDAAKSGLQNIQLRNAQMEIQNSTLPEKNKLILEEIAQRLSNMRSTHTNQEIQNELERIKLEYRKNGVELGDEMPYRILSRILGTLK